MRHIVTKQNEPRMLSLLRARRRIYSKMKSIQGAAVLVTLLLPVISLLAASYLPAAKAYVASMALIIGLTEIVFVDRWRKGRMKAAARMQEEFDCAVLDMHHNEFLVGSLVDPEEVFELSKSPLDADNEARLRDWYPVTVDKVPLYVGRILCQRENLLYDSNVRKTYGDVLRGGLAVVVLVLFFYSLAMGLQLEAAVLTVWVPAMPAISWALREMSRQGDTVDTLVRLKSESEKLWRAAGSIAPEVAMERSRELQDAVYSHRVSSPLVFDFLYRFRRNDLEAQMNAGADHLVSEYLRSAQVTALGK